jgi:hypothetical protein
MAAKQRVQQELLHGATLIDALREHPYLQRLLHDDALRTQLQDALQAGLSTDEPAAKKGRGRVLVLAVVGAGLAVVLSGGLRDKLLDLLFGPEETFDYVPASNGNGNGSAPAAAASEGAAH